MQSTTSTKNENSTSTKTEEQTKPIILKLNKPKKAVHFTDETEDNEFKQMKTSKSNNLSFII